MSDLKSNALHLLTLTSILISAAADNACPHSIRNITDYGSESPFVYCFNDGAFIQPSDVSFQMDDSQVCSKFDTPRVQLRDIEINELKGRTPCSFSKLNYKVKKNASCISSLVKPFLETFSGKTPSPAKVKTPPFKAGTVRNQGEIISYLFECIEGKHTIDMCRHNASFFEGRSKVKMLFDRESLGRSSNCYCSVTTPDIYSLTARALDIRLNGGNRLLFDSYELPSKEFYWWRDGVLSSSFSNVKLLNIESEEPSSVWMSLNGVNLTITCDNKPLDRPGDNGSHSSSSSAGGFSIVYIIGIIVGCIVLLILMFLMMRCLKSNKHKRDDTDMEEYEVADAIPDRSSSHPEEETLIPSQLNEEYAKPSKRQDGKTSVDIELYDKPRIYKPVQDESDENQVMNNNQSSDASSTDSIECSSKENLSGDTNAVPNIYSHLGDKPDLVPSASSNIYDVTGKDDYSLLERHPSTVRTDNLYDVA